MTMKTKLLHTKFLKKSFFLLAAIVLDVSAEAQTGGAVYQVGPVMMRTKIYPMATVLDNGKVISFGGREFNFVSCAYSDMYDPIANTFTEAPMNFTHDGSVVVKLSDGRYFLLGGCDDLGVAPGYSTTEMYNPTTNTFDIKASMTMARMNHAAAQISSNKVLVAGAWYNDNGATYGEVYDIGANSFTATGALNQPRANPIVIPTNDGGAVVAGGWPSYGGSIYKSVEYYQVSTNNYVVQSSELIPSDPGWLLNPIYTRPIADSRLSNGDYLLLASRSSSTSEYALITFDPETKLFSKLNTSVPLMDALTDGGFFDVILNKADNFAYLMGVHLNADPQQLSLITVDLTTGTTYHPINSFTLPAQEYLNPAMTYMASNGKILIQGISSATGTNFAATDKTYLLTPVLTAGIHDETNKSYLSVFCYPNPANDQLNIELKVVEKSEYKIRLIDILGREIICDSKQISSIGKTTLNYNLNDVKQGVYTLTVQDKNHVNAQNVIITK